MKVFAALLVLLIPWQVFGQTIIERAVDLEYRQVMDSPIGVQIIRTLNQLRSARDAAQEVEEIQGADSTSTWCSALFTGTPSCTSAGDAEYDLTNFAEQAYTQLIKLWECANNQTCNANNRLPKFRRAANELHGALGRDAAPEIEKKWQQAIRNLANEARSLNDEWVKRLDSVNAQSAQMLGSKTAQQLCNTQWFVGSSGCGTEGDDQADRLRSEDLKAALEAMDDMFDCANDVACGQGDRLTPLQKYVRIR